MFTLREPCSCSLVPMISYNFKCCWFSWCGYGTFRQRCIQVSKRSIPIFPHQEDLRCRITVREWRGLWKTECSYITPYLHRKRTPCMLHSFFEFCGSPVKNRGYEFLCKEIDLICRVTRSRVSSQTQICYICPSLPPSLSVPVERITQLLCGGELI